MKLTRRIQITAGLLYAAVGTELFAIPFIWAAPSLPYLARGIHLISLLLILAGILWGAFAVRCPHCGHRLPISEWRARSCRYCGKSLDKDYE